MPKKVKIGPSGIWKQVARAQRIGLSEGMRGKGSTWLAVGIGAWGLQRLHAMTDKEDEILLREPVAPGQTITITNQTTTRVEAKQAQQQAEAEGKRLEKRATKAEKAAKKARKGLSKAERRQLDAQQAQAQTRKDKASRRARRRAR